MRGEKLCLLEKKRKKNGITGEEQFYFSLSHELSLKMRSLAKCHTETGKEGGWSGMWQVASGREGGEGKREMPLDRCINWKGRRNGTEIDEDVENVDKRKRHPGEKGQRREMEGCPCVCMCVDMRVWKSFKKAILVALKCRLPTVEGKSVKGSRVVPGHATA